MLVFLGGDPDNFGSCHPVQEDIALRTGRMGRVGSAEQQPAAQPCHGGGNGGGAAVVGLSTAAGEHAIGFLRQSIGQGKFKLAHLVARKGHAG